MEEVTESIKKSEAVSKNNNTTTTTTIPNPISQTTLRRIQEQIRNNGFSFSFLEDQDEFFALIKDCQQQIEKENAKNKKDSAIRISAGSSGSYFIKNSSNIIVGVFKPHDEEPYGNLNPKWTKWLHRRLCPCFFGRKFLTPATGFLSEAAASTVDTFFGLGMVPMTQIIHLKSQSFQYSLWQRCDRLLKMGSAAAAGSTTGSTSENQAAQNQSEVFPFPTKLGSFQLHVKGFEESSIILQRMDDMRPLERGLREDFQEEFEKMVILDYLIRNTDRSSDNWMIHLSFENVFGFGNGDDFGNGNGGVNNDTKNNNNSTQSTINLHPTPATHVLDVRDLKKSLYYDNNAMKRHNFKSEKDLKHNPNPNVRPRVKIACIDHGLAFPFYHPNDWPRSYGYDWQKLPESKIPFSPKIQQKMLPFLKNEQLIENLVNNLEVVFSIDDTFDPFIFRRQMAVMRGQMHNLTLSLERGESPSELVERPMLRIFEDGQWDVVSGKLATSTSTSSSSSSSNIPQECYPESSLPPINKKKNRKTGPK